MKLPTIIGAAAALAAVGTMQGAVLIDDFDFPPFQVVSGIAAIGTPDTETDFGSALNAGLDRTMAIGGSESVGIAGGVGGVGRLATSENEAPSLTFTYDSVVVSLGGTATFTLDITANDTPGQASTVTFKLTDTSAGTGSWTSPAIGAAPVSLTSPALSTFGVDLSNIKSIELIINANTAGADVSVDNFAVPEPSTYAAMFALGLAGFAAFRRFRS